MARIEIITIGDELVEGRLVDSNAAVLSDRLAAEGYRVMRHLSVGDDRQEIIAALREMVARCDAILVSGGLGPTSDDITAATAAEAFGLHVVRSPQALQHVSEFFASRGRRMSPNNEKQADLPEGSTVLPNPLGTAVGFRVDAGRSRVYFMPGVPRELEHILSESVVPDLRRRLERAPLHIATLKIFGKGESDVAEALEDIGADLPPDARLTVQYRASFPEIHVRLMVDGVEGRIGEELVCGVAGEVRERLSKYVFASGGATVATTFAERAVEDLRRVGATLAAVEGCTDGTIGQLVSAVDGGDEVFRGSFIATSSAQLRELIGAPEADADLDAEITERLAQELAETVRESFSADLGVATLGTAGGSDGVPAGTILIAVADGERISSRGYSFPIERERFRTLAAYIALGQVRRAIANHPGR